MLFFIIFLFLFSYEIFSQNKNPIQLIEQLQILERRINQEIQTSRAKGITKGTYISIYSHSEKVFELSEGIQANSLFPIASISKPFTAFSVLKLVEGGYVKFHDPISKYIPEFKEFIEMDAISIQDLLHHTSGLPNSSGETLLTLSIGAREYRIPCLLYTS
ncbi:MAG: beta-lactamase family protein, partial [Leptospiraceae bacterium]|nr:beta-lactamase family protein [Leptospiraceae bacterium]